MEGLTAADPQAVGEFRLRARLGAGGMGQVFLATSPGGRMVAVKVIHPELARDSEFVRRFRAEVEAARRVSGMYTAPVVAAGVDDRPPWLATAFVPGPSLADIVSRYGPLPVPALWRLAAGLADALRAIHATGLVHRDLKPANVLLASDGPRVIDFGISRAVTDPRLTATGAIIGTPSFMSPEQVEGNAAGPPSDVFSLGSVLAFAACGVSPFSADPGGSSASVLYRVVHGSPELGMVPMEVLELIQACLAKEAAWRPDLGQVAAHCAAAAEYLGMSPVAFWPPEVARVIEAQQTALAAEVEALPVPPSVGMPAFQGVSASVGQAMSAGWPQTGPSRLGSSDPTGARASAGAPGQTGPSALPAQSGARVNVSRRNLLIGAGMGGAVVAGVAAWVIGSRSPASNPQAVGHESTMAGVPVGAGAGGTGAETGGGGTGPGSAAWTFTTGDEILSNPGVGNGVVYVGSKDNYLYAVNAATGKQIWKSRQGWVAAAPQVVNGMVCVATTTGEFSAIHATTGDVAWQQQTGTPAAFKPNWAVDGGFVILPSTTQPLTVYDAVTGSRGTTTFGSPGQFAGGAIGAANGVLYAVQESSALFAVRIATGTILWQRSVSSNGSGFFTSIVASDGAIYITDDSGMLYSLNAANGNSNWSYPAGASQLSTPVTVGGMVYVTDDSGILHAITTARGKQVWTHQTISSGEIGPAVNGSELYVSTGQALQALDAKTGNAVWSYTPPNTGAFVSTPAVANGLVFVGSTNDNLYAIRA
jgi:outer membrane protein assembly factor BamB